MPFPAYFHLPLQARKFGLVRESNPRTPASQAPSPGLKVCVKREAKRPYKIHGSSQKSMLQGP